MKESTKTICFVVTAAVLGLAAIGNAFMNQPSNSTASELVGTPFYENFTSTEAARSLEVSAVDPETGSLKRFGVESDGDLWRIPTHFDYPAEGAARIAQTSASVMGLDRQALVGMGESEYEKFGVVDPLSEELEDPETAGKRVTLKDENGDPLVDYIIGKEIEETVPTRGGSDDAFEAQNQAKDFYIRRADESQTFRVSLDIDLSTKFSDWIDTDLLRINRPDVTQISINNYQIEERGVGSFGVPELFKKQGDQIALTRPSPAEKWALEGLNQTAEEIQTAKVDEILGVLDQMLIVGVRPKFKFEGKQLLTADLKLANIPELKKDRNKASRAIQELQRDLMDKGFNFGGTQNNPELVSENGEIEFGTSKGLRYRLHIGEAAADKDDKIAIGSTETETKPESETEGQEAGDKPEVADDANRFLFVRVSFDESLLGERGGEPVKPEAPVKPEGYEPAKAKEKMEGEEAKPTGDAESAEDNDADAEKPAEERKPEFIAYEEALIEFEKAKQTHEMDMTRFNQENEAYDKKIEKGKELADKLNQRFGDWFYVISASNLKTIQSKREDIVKPIPPPPGAPVVPPTPDRSFPNMPQGKSTFDTPEKMADENKGDEKPETKESAAEDKPAMENAEPAKEAEKPQKPEEKSEPAVEKEKPVEEKTEPAVEKEKPATEKVDPEPAKVEPKKDETGQSDKPVEPKKEPAEDAENGDS